MAPSTGASLCILWAAAAWSTTGASASEIATRDAFARSAAGDLRLKLRGSKRMADDPPPSVEDFPALPDVPAPPVQLVVQAPPSPVPLPPAQPPLTLPLPDQHEPPPAPPGLPVPPAPELPPPPPAPPGLPDLPNMPDLSPKILSALPPLPSSLSSPAPAAAPAAAPAPALAPAVMLQFATHAPQALRGRRSDDV
eukprot:TRINITY_DN64272_c0_g1_i1.p1 TRINITY_DN64272_c0_g1~~TRINITY_DN64272_c0_g1_i1.p1  ORF type:complete len:195 (+),score=39.51 TRINITY_DN64272_c0_g1_i1:83-667(+)